MLLLCKAGTFIVYVDNIKRAKITKGENLTKVENMRKV